jgi:uncharacterized membrane protein YedE/YeeE
MSTENSTDFETRSLDAMCVNESQLEHKWHHNLKYLLAGMLFGIVLVKAEVVSWFRIQEMFRMESFHMYGVIGSAVAVGALSVFFIRKFNIRTIYGENIVVHPKPFDKGAVFGGLTFGIGWAMTGACPGPLYALVGAGATVIIVTVLSAILGTYVYGVVRERLPH